jgi:hypothetical protein
MPVLAMKSNPNPSPATDSLRAMPFEPSLLGIDTFAPRSQPTVREAAPSADRVCGAQGCTSTWLMPWKNRRRPIFEQEWACSGRCLSALVKAAVRREIGDVEDAIPEETHRHRVPLGLVLLAQGWITNPQLQTALQAQRASGRGRIGDWLTQGCGLDEGRITRGLSAQWNCPVLSLDGFSPSAMALAMPKRLIVEFGLLPLRIAGTSLLYLAFQERMDAATSRGVGRMAGLNVECGLLSGTRFEAARTRLLEAEGVPVRMHGVDADGLASAIVKVVDNRQPLATRLVRVHHYYWLRMWLETGTMAGTGTLPPGPGDVEDHLFMMHPNHKP